MHSSRIVIAITLLCSLGACSERSSTGGGGSSLAIWSDYCETGWTAYQDRCGIPYTAADVTDCQAQCFASLITPARIRVATACAAGRACGTSDDACFATGITPSAVAIAYQAACLDRQVACGGVFSDDLCSADILTDSAISSLEACLSDPCDAIRACADALIAC